MSMRHLLERVSVMGLMFLAGCSMCGSTTIREPVAPAYIQSVGGTNFAFYRIDAAYLERNEPKVWWRPGVLHHVVGAFHLQTPGTVERTLAQMYAGGQRKIAIVLWHVNIERERQTNGLLWEGPTPSGYEDIYGHTLNCAGGALSPQHQKNLRALLTAIEQTGFETVILRFAGQGVNNPMDWKTWSEIDYQENHAFILSVKQIADGALAENTELLYDLGLELGGLNIGQCAEYNRRLWKDYTDAFGVDDTLGFSVAVEPNRITRLVEMYRASGQYPAAYPLDIYYDADRVLGYVAEEFDKSGIDDPAVIIQETFYNDAQTLAEIQAAAREHDLTILYILQWQVQRERMLWYDEDGTSSLRHFSIDRPINFENYLKRTQ